MVDQLPGFVDIHNHILPGIDDGARHLQQSIELLWEMQGFGVKKCICTPHIMGEIHPNTPKTIYDAHQLVQDEILRHEGLHLMQLDAAAEHMIDDMFETILEKEHIMPLHKDYLLVEMSYLHPSINFEEMVYAISTKDYIPILAHPERYSYLRHKPQLIPHYKSLGVQMQLNLLSLGEYYGSSIQKTAFSLMEEGQIDYFGSDVHNMRQLGKLKEVVLKPKSVELIRPIIDRTIETFC
ncbi:MAG: histidinol phosphatase [Flavobacteriaceae bacterium]|nr:histidinol phosphatase [Flavobacteriaceae bacterium]